MHSAGNRSEHESEIKTRTEKKEKSKKNGGKRMNNVEWTEKERNKREKLAILGNK
jgi:hypothetical protein